MIIKKNKMEKNVNNLQKLCKVIRILILVVSRIKVYSNIFNEKKKILNI